MDRYDGFLRYPRQSPKKQPVKKRVRHWREYIQILPEAQTLRQSSRCMDCGTPGCHAYCPVHNLIPDWNGLVSDTQWHDAYLALDSTNNFPEFTGRLCPAPCEHACTLTVSDRPVTIKAIEKEIADKAWEQNWVRPHHNRRHRKERIAVIGSGPAGLSCAQQLARVGYRVTVYEKADRPGGLLRYGIPDFRLEKQLLDRRLKQLRDEAVVFQTGVYVGRNLPVTDLLESSDAVVLACGSEQPRQLQIPIPRLKGIYYALEYLTQQNHRLAGDIIEPEAAILARDKDVVVIGGGDTGSDCVGTAIRQGARSVIQIQYHERPANSVNIRDHWPEPAPVYCQNDREQEGCRRIWGWNTTEFTAENGRVTGLQLQRMVWRKTDNISGLRLIDDKSRHLPGQLVLIAIGYAHPVHEVLLTELGANLDNRGNIAANDQDYRTSVPGVFACGDARRGQSLVVWAIREGRQAACAVDKALMGTTKLPR